MKIVCYFSPFGFNLSMTQAYFHLLKFWCWGLKESTITGHTVVHVFFQGKYSQMEVVDYPAGFCGEPLPSELGVKQFPRSGLGLAQLVPALPKRQLLGGAFVGNRKWLL